LEDEVLKTWRQRLVPQLVVHGSEPFSEVIAIRVTEIRALVLSEECGQDLHKVPRCYGDRRSHVLSPTRTVADRLHTLIDRSLWQKDAATVKLSTRTEPAHIVERMGQQF
jgi:hypothetical protein